MVCRQDFWQKQAAWQTAKPPHRCHKSQPQRKAKITGPPQLTPLPILIAVRKAIRRMPKAFANRNHQANGRSIAQPHARQTTQEMQQIPPQLIPLPILIAVHKASRRMPRLLQNATTKANSTAQATTAVYHSKQSKKNTAHRPSNQTQAARQTAAALPSHTLCMQ